MPKKALDILIKYTFLQKKLAIISLLLALVVSTLEGLSTPFVMLIIQNLGNTNSSITSTGLFAKLSESYSFFSNEFRLSALIISFLILTILKNISLYFSSTSINDFQLRIGRSIRSSCIQRFFELELAFYNRSNLGELVSYVNEQSQRSELLSSHVIEICREVLTIFMLAIILVSLSPILTAINILCVLLGMVLIKIFLKRVQFYGNTVSKSIDRFSSFITESLSGIRVIKSFGSETRSLKCADSYLQERYEAEMQAFRYSSAIGPITETVGISILMLILSAGSFVSRTDSDALPLLLTYSYTLLRLIPRINHLNSLRSSLALLSGSLESIHNFLDSTRDIHLADGKKVYKGLTSSICIENITFTFGGNTEPTLKNVDFVISKGSTTALVGASGSGKSTIVDLVMRFHDPNSGRILLDGIDLRDFKISSWRSRIAIVSQETFLFHASIRENIAYGRPDASDSEIIEASKKAYAYEFIQELPNGFETTVGDRGARLSGGQRQRIAIARAILLDPDVLILDEATSALDSNSERIVQKAIEEVSRDRTVIVIAHRLSTIEKANKIVVINNGCVAEQGSHRELLAFQGKYWALYESHVSM